jgi:hypothetical protein
MIAEAVFVILDAHGGIGAQLVGLAQIFFPRRVYVEQGYERHLRERFELNVVAKADDHRVQGFLTRHRAGGNEMQKSSPPNGFYRVHFFLLAWIANSAQTFVPDAIGSN